MLSVCAGSLVAVIGSVVLVGSCASEKADDASDAVLVLATGSTDAIEVLRARAVVLPAVVDGEACPVETHAAQLSEDLGPLWGSGLARPVLGDGARVGLRRRGTSTRSSGVAARCCGR